MAKNTIRVLLPTLQNNSLLPQSQPILMKEAIPMLMNIDLIECVTLMPERIFDGFDDVFYAVYMSHNPRGIFFCVEQLNKILKKFSPEDVIK